MIKTTCAYCGVGCGVTATPRRGGGFDIAGDAAHPANQGRLCVKGSALGETIGLEGRLLYPMMRERGADGSRAAQPQRVAWGEALDRVAGKWRAIIDEHGPDAVAFYVSGQLLTEDYYVANKLVKGYIGSANIDTNSRLCMSSAVAGHKRAFGEDVVPVNYDDIEHADMVVLVGSNLAWCHPILFQRLTRAKEARPEMKIVVIDPRRTATCELADLHLPIKPGTDVWLFNGLLSYLSRIGAVDPAFVAARTNGLEDALAAADMSPADVARACRVNLQDLMEFYESFAGTAKVITGFSMGVNQSSAGTDKVNAIINCHLIGGRIGKQGMGPFSITGQPNAMGGREVGGLANMLAAHLDLDNAAHRDAVQTFWSSPRIASRPGLKAVDLFEAIESGRVKAVWVIATNPVVSLPNADQVRRALERCELVVVSDVVRDTDTNAYADVLLPALAWGEKDGTVTNSERRISRQRAFLPAPGEARADWLILSQFALRMGYDGFGYASAAEIFTEHARLSAWRNAPGQLPRAFNIGALATLGESAYDALPPTQWPTPVAATAAIATLPAPTAAFPPAAASASVAASPLLAAAFAPPATAPEPAAAAAPSSAFASAAVAGLDGKQNTARIAAASEADAPSATRPFADGRFSHPDGRARFIPTTPRAPANLPDGEYPIALNTGRVRDHWHTMTRTGRAPKLADHIPESFIDMHPQDALLCGVKEGELARVTSQWGSMVARVQHGGGIARGSAFVPIHWNNQIASDARIGAVVNPVVDPISGEPEFKHTPVMIDRFPVKWHGFILSRDALQLDALAYWTKVQGKDFQRYELAGRNTIKDFGEWARQLLGIKDDDADWLEYADRSSGVLRAVHLVDDRIAQCIFISARPDLPARQWLASLFEKEQLELADRAALLAGRPIQAGADAGATVCSCFGVGRNTICNAIREKNLTTPAQITACVKAGGNCGSCVPELKKLLVETRVKETA
ncbi:molybdopterin-dependent oxidoreductase [Pseudoduganella sp. DS3]|uniref:Molybdopterin-dependent oxidoreductase n=1 Tax=Pseudoduganella guangdongensis TaxID=2692179 RepID=A0A6N9HB19_9BURK|nr:nitrate reductase [Pseudoduganella guangdongensis]MYN00698.1 molybdopterin-dependent oxidoreductase [Pseudoduganella guangdongensis]